MEITARGIEIDDGLWTAAQAEAKARGEDVDTALARLLAAYVEGRDRATSGRRGRRTA
ncbi:hypothetical protein [Nocardioides sp.]|uniref:hypothetical protein n=1 Tax=Nocardioides sp. TaxID=35761 RepID=UPI0037845A88